MKRITGILFAIVFALTVTLILREDLLRGFFGNFAGKPFLLFAPVASALSAWLWVVSKNFRGALLVYLLSAAAVFWTTLRALLP